MDIRMNDPEPSVGLVKALIDAHKSSEDLKKEKTNQSYYDGHHAIMERVFDDKDKPNNRIVTNFCKYITDISTGYFIGDPISYSSDADKYLEKLQEIFNLNDEQYVNARLAKYASVYGRAAEIMYTVKENDEKAKVKFTALDPGEQYCVFIYSANVESDLIMALRYYEHSDILSNKKETHAFLYTDKRIYHYVSTEGGFALRSDDEHFFSDVPLTPYYNKSETAVGDFESVMTLNDAYNSLQSDDVDESEYSNDAYLIIAGLEADEKDVKEMKSRRVIEVDNEGQVQWLTKDINDTWKENMKTRIHKDIHKISGVPDMTDESFSSAASGISIQYKLTPFEDNRAAKERSFKKGLQRRIKLITSILSVQGSDYDPNDISIRFSKNLPTDDQAVVNQATAVLGTRLVSRDTLRATLPMVEDPAKEREKLEAEEAEDLERFSLDDHIDEKDEEDGD
ncbi:phage portal protein [Geomicrobium sediminis]|uniref:SPP1 family phage portal protein n=1 Tax=Geomicrobium sediminis TaxID=1347788 RepID=A0ABS2PG45_9BACL|nr:phage portal protein [Geomicrobium sediminis]MBM7634066.1 SPP1 family phage portal protein [Geomicrobium sediminis]